MLKAGKNPGEAGRILGISGERVRQLMIEIGIRSQVKVRSEGRRRALAMKELKTVERLYASGDSMEKIAKSEDLDEEYVSEIIRENGSVRRLKYRVCGKGITAKMTLGRVKYCAKCARDLIRKSFAENRRRLYKTDPEFRRRKLRKNREWRRSATGRKWWAEYYAKVERER